MSLTETPFYMPSIGRVQLGSTETHRLGSLEPEEALALYRELEGVIHDMPWPRLRVVPDPDVPGCNTLQCPYCAHREDAVRAVDVAERGNDLSVDHPLQYVTGDYDGSGWYELLMYTCPECDRPVKLPEGWTEQ